MQEIIKTLAIAWFGACVRNKSDRDSTIKLINGVSSTIENTIKDFMPKIGKGGAVNEPIKDETVSIESTEDFT